jgi:splicing factor 3A subunit 3
VGAAPMSSNSSPPKQENFEPIDLHDINVAQELERFGLDHLKIELTRQNLKCGGSLEERANRLFLLKMTPFEAIDKKHKAMKKK